MPIPRNSVTKDMGRPMRTTIVGRIAVALLALMAAIIPVRAEMPPTPSAEDLIALIRKAVLALDHGNKNGDYTELFSLGTKDFQAAHPKAALAADFKNLRDAKLDLSLAAEKTPLSTGPPRMDPNGLLRLAGAFKFPDKEIVYDLLYTFDGDAKDWRLAGIAIRPRIVEEPPEIMQPQ